LRGNAIVTGAKRPLGALLLVTLLLAFTVACDGLEPGNPVLPEGFSQAQVPDASVKGFVYMRPGKPISVSTDRFLEGEEVGSGLPSEVDIGLWTVWVGPKPEDFGMGFQFVDLSALDLVAQELESRSDWAEYLRMGEWLYLFGGEVEWVEALKSSIEEGRFVGIEEAYPDEWELIRLLPETPPGEVLGAGFGKLDDEFLAGMEEQFGGVGSDVKSLVDSARLRSAAFALYARQAPAELAEFDEEFLKEMGLSGLIITKAGYPGFIINFLFNRAASGAGLEKVQIEGGDAFYKALQESLHVLIKNFGNTFYVAAASEEGSAQALMESVLVE